MNQLDYTREQMDSNEEYYSLWYINELIRHNILTEVEYHPQAFQLSDSVYNYYNESKTKKGKTSTIPVFREVMKAHIYTADWKLVWNTNENIDRFVTRYDEKLKGKVSRFFMAKMIGSKLTSYIDIKGASVNPRMSSSSTTFSLNQKWVYSKYGIYVQKVIPISNTTKAMRTTSSGLFVSTFTPARYLRTDADTMNRKIHYKPRTFTEFYYNDSQGTNSLSGEPGI